MPSAGVAQLVERKPSKLDVAGSSPVSRFRTRRAYCRRSSSGWTCSGWIGVMSLASALVLMLVQDDAIARVAQLAEHTLGKGEVIGSIPIASSGRL